jgi:hypothetical protein
VLVSISSSAEVRPRSGQSAEASLLAQQEFSPSNTSVQSPWPWAYVKGVAKRFFPLESRRLMGISDDAGSQDRSVAKVFRVVPYRAIEKRVLQTIASRARSLMMGLRRTHPRGHTQSTLSEENPTRPIRTYSTEMTLSNRHLNVKGKRG